MVKQTAAVLAKSGIVFGTSGARGLLSQFSQAVAAAFTQNFISIIKNQYAFDEVLLAIDARPSSEPLAAACAGALHALGYKVRYFGLLPTPALAWYALTHNMPAIMVTGSHIADDQNGLKFFRPSGEISKADEAAIMLQQLPLVSFIPKLPPVVADAEIAYTQRYLQAFPAVALSGKHIAVYQHSSAGANLYPAIFSALGAKVTCLAPAKHFVAIDTEALSSADRAHAKAWATEHKFDALFSTDADGDRPMLADEQGRWLQGDVIGLLCAKLLGIDTLAVSLNCTSAIELSGVFKKVIRTRMGSPYVLSALAEMQDEASLAGFEANGGFILASALQLGNTRLAALPTRDALLPVIAILALAGARPLSQLAASLPKRFTASGKLQKVTIAQSDALLTNLRADPQCLLQALAQNADIISTIQLDGIKWSWQNGNSVHVRASGNSPALRCYVEAGSENEATTLLNAAVKQLVKLLAS